MDFKDPASKQELERKISSLLTDYGTLFTDLCSKQDTYKKSALLYYWLRDYKNYITNEDRFSPQYYPEFYRGSIVNINFGFNIGSEIGGLHYAIVLCDSKKKNPTITIVPLTSLKPGKNPQQLRPTELYLGQELFHKIQGKYEALKISIPTEVDLLRAKMSSLTTNDIDAEKETIASRLDDLEKKSDLLVKTIRKLQSLKLGSIAVMNQVKTVSKLRIMDPADKYDILYNLKLSSQLLDSVDDKIIELFTRKS